MLNIILMFIGFLLNLIVYGYLKRAGTSLVILIVTTVTSLIGWYCYYITKRPYLELLVVHFTEKWGGGDLIFLVIGMAIFPPVYILVKLSLHIKNS